MPSDVRDFYPDSFDEWANKCFATHWEEHEHLNNNPYWDGSNPLYQKQWITDNRMGLMVSNVYRFEDLESVLNKITGKVIGKFNASTKHEISESALEKIRTQFVDDRMLYNSLSVE